MRFALVVLAHTLGLILGAPQAARRCYLEAIRLKPDFAIPWSNLAGIFKEEGQTATAVAYYREAIRLVPEFADAHSNLGNTLKEQVHSNLNIETAASVLMLRSVRGCYEKPWSAIILQLSCDLILPSRMGTWDRADRKSVV